jgi:hypothetical protein
MPSKFAGWNRLRVFASRVRGWVTIRWLDEDFQEELDAHLALLVDENIGRGMTPEDAPRGAVAVGTRHAASRDPPRTPRSTLG